MIKLNALYTVWNESKLFFLEYSKRLSQDIREIQKINIQTPNTSVHLSTSTYGYSLKDSDEQRQLALNRAVQATTKEKVLLRIKQLMGIWSTKANSSTGQTYMNHLLTDHKFLSSM